MQDLLTVTLVLAGLFFSITCALLLEELMFGLFFRVLWPARKIPTLSRQSRPRQGWGNRDDLAIPISQQRHEEGGLSCSH